MTTSGIAIPVALYRVPYETTTGRPFSTAERTVLSCVDAGLRTFDAVHAEMALHPRIVAECVTTLFETGLLEFDAGESFLLCSRDYVAVVDERCGRIVIQRGDAEYLSSHLEQRVHHWHRHRGRREHEETHEEENEQRRQQPIALSRPQESNEFFDKSHG